MKTNSIPQIKLTAKEVETLKAYTRPLQDLDQIILHPNQAMLMGHRVVQFNVDHGISSYAHKLAQLCFDKTFTMTYTPIQEDREKIMKEIEILNHIQDFLSFFTKVPSLLPNL